MANDAGDVFIPGGLPRSTYVSREHLGLEGEVRKWLGRQQKPLLSVSGPTKSGKTVLLKKLVPDAIWLSGGAITTSVEFWEQVCGELEVFTDHTLSASRTASDVTDVNGGLNAGFANVSAGSSTGTVDERSLERSRSSSPQQAGRKALKEAGRILVVDDFHYIPGPAQLEIVRSIKDLIFDGLGVAVCAVPHRAYDVVKVEREMTGRVAPMTLKHWDDPDLALIAKQGFGELDVEVAPHIVERLARESFGSPHLMQTHCLALCEAKTVTGVLDSVFADMTEPEWIDFFELQASATSKSAFDLLKTGPRTRTDRMPRVLKMGVTTDIYGAVLAAIEQTGPRTQLTYDEIRASLREILESELPQRHEVTNVLEQMTTIAREKIDGEPVLEYDAEYSTLHLADPFFAYYLRWAPQSLKSIAIHKDAAGL